MKKLILITLLLEMTTSLHSMEGPESPGLVPIIEVSDKTTTINDEAAHQQLTKMLPQFVVHLTTIHKAIVELLKIEQPALAQTINDSFPIPQQDINELFLNKLIQVRQEKNASNELKKNNLLLPITLLRDYYWGKGSEAISSLLNFLSEEERQKIAYRTKEALISSPKILNLLPSEKKIIYEAVYSMIINETASALIVIHDFMQHKIAPLCYAKTQEELNRWKLPESYDHLHSTIREYLIEIDQSIQRKAKKDKNKKLLSKKNIDTKLAFLFLDTFYFGMGYGDEYSPIFNLPLDAKDNLALTLFLNHKQFNLNTKAYEFIKAYQDRFIQDSFELHPTLSDHVTQETITFQEQQKFFKHVQQAANLCNQFFHKVFASTSFTLPCHNEYDKNQDIPQKHAWFLIKLTNNFFPSLAQSHNLAIPIWYFIAHTVLAQSAGKGDGKGLIDGTFSPILCIPYDQQKVIHEALIKEGQEYTRLHCTNKSLSQICHTLKTASKFDRLAVLYAAGHKKMEDTEQQEELKKKNLSSFKTIAGFGLSGLLFAAWELAINRGRYHDPRLSYSVITFALSASATKSAQIAVDPSPIRSTPEVLEGLPLGLFAETLTPLTINTYDPFGQAYKRYKELSSTKQG